jgi:toluene monooxygenase system ferredoxin subunit
MTLCPVAPVDSLWSGEMLAARAGRFRVLLLNVEGEIRAYEDRCLHQGVALSEGRFDGSTLVCRAHGWQYDARTGQGVNPCAVHLRSFAVVIDQGRICVDLTEEP